MRTVMPDRVIRAGQKHELDWEAGTWLFLDIGFSSTRKSCGLIVHAEKGKVKDFLYTFGAAKQKILQQIQDCKTPINLVIEAPLSVAFYKENPVRRKIETQVANLDGKTKTRDWYHGAGCTTMMAAIYLIREIHDTTGAHEIRLFEAFMSFKGKKKQSTDHATEVEQLRESLQKRTFSVFTGSELKEDPKHSLRSSFEVLGLADIGIPPVIMVPQNKF